MVNIMADTVQQTPRSLRVVESIYKYIETLLSFSYAYSILLVLIKVDTIFYICNYSLRW